MLFRFPRDSFFWHGSCWPPKKLANYYFTEHSSKSICCCFLQNDSIFFSKTMAIIMAGKNK